MHGLSSGGAARTVMPIQSRVSYPVGATVRTRSSGSRAVSSRAAGPAIVTAVPGVTTPVSLSNDGSQSPRLWTDNTGTFQLVARLTEVQSQKVILLNENGLLTGVPWRRLSAKDQNFVRAQLAAIGSDKG